MQNLMIILYWHFSYNMTKYCDCALLYLLIRKMMFDELFLRLIHNFTLCNRIYLQSIQTHPFVIMSHSTEQYANFINFFCTLCQDKICHMKANMNISAMIMMRTQSIWSEYTEYHRCINDMTDEINWYTFNTQTWY